MELNLWHCQLKICRSLKGRWSTGDCWLGAAWTLLCFGIFKVLGNCALGWTLESCGQISICRMSGWVTVFSTEPGFQMRSEPFVQPLLAAEVVMQGCQQWVLTQPCLALVAFSSTKVRDELRLEQHLSGSNLLQWLVYPGNTLCI